MPSSPLPASPVLTPLDPCHRVVGGARRSRMLTSGAGRPRFPRSYVSREDAMARSRNPAHGSDKEPNRRRSCRYPAKVRAAVLGWDADGCRVELPVELDDISIHGCLVKSRVCPAPKPGELIWFSARLDPQAWIEGVLVSTIKPFLRQTQPGSGS